MAKFALLDKNGVVIQTQPNIQPHEFAMGFIVVDDLVVPGQIKQKDGTFVNPPIDDNPD